MSLPSKYRELLLSDLEPGEMYRRCLAAISHDELSADYALTETIVYATEVRYAIDVIANGPPERLWNFGDLDGRSTSRLFEVLDGVPEMRLAFAGSGPYPITALLAAQRYPDARDIACIDNNIVGHLLGRAVVDAMDLAITSVFAEAADVDYSPFDVVVVAAMVSGKQQLVDQVLRTSDALVVVRGEAGVSDPRLVEINATFRDDGSVKA
ncbi:MAG: hypothetical protein GEV08_13405 [Acidimicrobiia bacterium]|nr:hypothetical protein [Acidimicrobiia bacterium]